MQGLLRLSHLLAVICQLVAGIALLALMSITVIDVLMRMMFRLSGGALNWSVIGSVELVSYLMMFSLLAAMAANIEKSQVVVEAFSHRLPEALKQRLGGFFLLGFVGLGGVLAVGLWQAGIDARAYGEVTQDLRLPMGPIYQSGAVLCALLTARSLVHAVLGGVFAVEGGAGNEQ
ncbi:MULTISPECIES: TRAP transporter small permease [Halomonadaceae]|uniref:TRAP transporter small permease n=1 Tax=Halomonadaceae TaxID=28256 RepID=UPI001599D12F|nr:MULTISPECIES: TRAP transporter small permease subunit [Halomonas]QJQ95991.1 TRAP transporter small permease [Halomonas sp. PA5]